VEWERAIEGHDPLGQPRETIRQFPASTPNPVAAELAVALGLEDLRETLGGERRNLESCGLLSRQANESSPDAPLPHRGSCTRIPGNADGPGAAFAVIGAFAARREQRGDSLSVDPLAQRR